MKLIRRRKEKFGREVKKMKNVNFEFKRIDTRRQIMLGHINLEELCYKMVTVNVSLVLLVT